MSAAVPVPRRLSSTARLLGDDAIARLAGARVLVAGLGGVGSWAAEALARSGVGALVLVDLDHVAETNLNRQVLALESTLGMAKVDAMAQRIADIAPDCRVDTVDAFVEPDSVDALLQRFGGGVRAAAGAGPQAGAGADAGADADAHAGAGAGADAAEAADADAMPLAVLDATDDTRAKAALVAAAHARGLALVVCGATGGRRDPARLRRSDLALVRGDPLLASVRARLRREHGFAREAGRPFGVEAVHSDEPAAAWPAAPEGGDTRRGGAPLACAGYGSIVTVTAASGMVAAGALIDALLRGAPRRG